MPQDTTLQQVTRLVAEAGFLGTSYGLDRTARTLFEALAEYKPENAVPIVGLINVYLAQGKADEAIRIADNFLLKGKMTPTLSLYYGFAHVDNKQTAQGDAYIREAVMSGDKSVLDLLKNSKYRGPAFEEAERMGLI